MGKRGRKPELIEKMESTFPLGTFARINAVIEGGKRTDYVRRAVRRALERDEETVRLMKLQRKGANHG